MSRKNAALLVDRDHPAWRDLVRGGMESDPLDEPTRGVGAESHLRPWLAPIEAQVASSLVQTPPPVTPRSSLHVPERVQTPEPPAAQSWWARWVPWRRS